LVSVHRTFPHWRNDPARVASWQDINLAYPEFRDWQAQQRTFQNVAAWNWAMLPLRWNDGTELVDVLLASASLLETLQVRPQMGRNFLPEEEGWGAARVALISDEFWRTRLAGASDVLGQRLILDGEPHQIIGVLPPRLELVRIRVTPDIWRPAGTMPGDTTRQNLNYTAMARLHDGVTLQQAEQETQRIFRFDGPAGESGAALFDLRDDGTRGVRQGFLLLLAAAVLLMLITCVNVAALLLGEGAARDGEVAARLALGAARGRILRQLLTEQLVLALAGSLLGFLFAQWATRLLVGLAPPFTPRLADVRVDLRSLLFALSAAALTSAVFGLAPALTLARASAGSVLRAGSSRLSRRRTTLQRAAIVMQLALAVVLLIGATLLVRSLGRLTAVPPGFNAAGLIYLSPQLGSRYPAAADAHIFFRELVERTRALPGVQAASAASSLPFTDGGSGTRMIIDRASGQEEMQVQWRVVMPDFPGTVGIPLVAGRPLRDSDSETAQPVILVSEVMARNAWPEQNPIGRRLQYAGKWREVVGVVGDVKQLSLQQEPRPTVYLPPAQSGARLIGLAVRVAGDPATAVTQIRSIIQQMDPGVAVRQSVTITSQIERTLADERFRAIITAFFAIVAGLLTAAGLYGVTADAVTRRMRELAIRIALGASEQSVVQLVVRSTLALGCVGVLAGALAALASIRALQPFLFGITGTDVSTYALVMAGVLLVTLLAAWLPARSAALSQPAALLRSD
jgi:predicted permease